MKNAAILGFGVVGSGVAEVLTMNAAHIAKKAGEEISLKYILDVRDFPDSPFADKFVKDFSVIENDPDVQVVVESIGGARIAYEFTKRALSAGKSVVTSNKELVATKGYELLKIAAEKKVSYLFEASVGGGIPVLHPLFNCLSGNEITEIAGILNGTTNYILTKMIKEGLSFGTALSQAQANGYAEADPTADVEGIDACRKICILSALAFGRHVYPQQAKAEGITGVTLADTNYAASCSCKIKLLGRSVRAENDKIYVFVAPHLVPTDNPLASVEDVFNGIMITGNAVDRVMFYGRGAGKLPTASAVVSDVIEAVMAMPNGEHDFWDDTDPLQTLDSDLYVSRWYARVSGAALPAGISAVQLSGVDSPKTESAFLTAPFSKTDILKKLKGFDVLSLIRVLD